MTIKIGDPVFDGLPSEPGVKVVRVRGAPGELYAWFDGKRFGHGHPDVVGARGDKPLFGGRLPDSRVERRELEYWRPYAAKFSLVDLLKAALGRG